MLKKLIVILLLIAAFTIVAGVIFLSISRRNFSKTPSVAKDSFFSQQETDVFLTEQSIPSEFVDPFFSKDPCFFNFTDTCLLHASLSESEGVVNFSTSRVTTESLKEWTYTMGTLYLPQGEVFRFYLERTNNNYQEAYDLYLSYMQTFVDNSQIFDINPALADVIINTLLGSVEEQRKAAVIPKIISNSNTVIKNISLAQSRQKTILPGYSKAGQSVFLGIQSTFPEEKNSQIFVSKGLFEEKYIRKYSLDFQENPSTYDLRFVEQKKSIQEVFENSQSDQIQFLICKNTQGYVCVEETGETPLIQCYRFSLKDSLCGRQVGDI